MNRASDPVLERQGRRMIRPAVRFFLISLIPMIPGIVLIVIGHDGLLGLGIALIFIASCPLAIAIGLLVSGSVARWAARYKLFA
jgi:uncharacterized membrane protein YdjX (TVP38/TMEM64 family)